MALRIIFMGTPDFAVPTLTGLANSGHEVVAVYSQPPRRAGRGMELQISPVHKEAEKLGIPVHTPTSLRDDEELSIFSQYNADVAVVVAYGMLLPETILNAPRLGCYNGHASLLPRWRGAAPIQRAIMAGDNETGVMVMRMEKGLDTGPVATSVNVGIGADMTADELHDQLMHAGADLMVQAMDSLDQGQLDLTPQPKEGVTYASKIEKSEARIDWNKDAADVHNHIRGLSPFPGAWCEMDLSGKSTRVKILKSHLVETSGKPGEILDGNLTIACKQGAVRISHLQRAGKQPSSAEEFLRGNAVTIGSIIN